MTATDRATASAEPPTPTTPTPAETMPAETPPEGVRFFRVEAWVRVVLGGLFYLETTDKGAEALLAAIHHHADAIGRDPFGAFAYFAYRLETMGHPVRLAPDPSAGWCWRAVCRLALASARSVAKYRGVEILR